MPSPRVYHALNQATKPWFVERGRAVAERFPEVCAAEEEFLQTVLGAAVERRTHIVQGCNACQYHVSFNPPAPAPESV